MHRNVERKVHESRQIGNGQTGDGKSEHRHFRNQWTKVGWDGQIWNSTGQNTGVGSLYLLQGIFPIQRLNPGLPHCRQILYQLSHKGSPRILEWLAYPSLLQQIFPTQVLNQDFLHCKQILYQLSYQVSPKFNSDDH